MSNFIKTYLEDISSKEFREDKHKRFFWMQFSVIVVCCFLNAIWVLKDIFIRGIGPTGSLELTIISRTAPTLFLIPFIIVSIKYKKLEPFLSNAMMYINIICQFLGMHFVGAPSGGTANVVVSFGIFILHYVSASGISQVFAQIVYPIALYVCSQNGFGLYEFSVSPASLLYSNMIFSIACIIAGFIFRGNYYNAWINECKLITMSKTDSMSGVWNRKRISDITDNEKLKSDSTIIMLDIDNFKSLNDNNGHDFGDQAIYDTVKFLKRAFADGNIIRYGGDEFLVVISKKTSFHNIKLRAANSNLREDITYSIGVADGEEGDDIYGIIKHADIALYKAKETKNTIISFQNILT